MFNLSRCTFCGFRATKRNPNLLVPTEAQMDALNAVHSFAEKSSMALPTQTGDMLYLNNTSMLHARKLFEDRDTKSGGHMLKLQLRD